MFYSVVWSQARRESFATAAAGSGAATLAASAALQSSSSASADTAETVTTPLRTTTPRKTTPRKYSPRKRKVAGLQAGVLNVVKEMVEDNREMEEERLKVAKLMHEEKMKFLSNFLKVLKGDKQKKD